ncbi:MAG: hypothetical protein OXC95_18650 [Dehalococcoidia bacterium]|nr:hypothetical protein [Dehalococcoidia bacterium]
MTDKLPWLTRGRTNPQKYLPLSREYIESLGISDSAAALIEGYEITHWLSPENREAEIYLVRHPSEPSYRYEDKYSLEIAEDDSDEKILADFLRSWAERIDAEIGSTESIDPGKLHWQNISGKLTARPTKKSCAPPECQETS